MAEGAASGAPVAAGSRLGPSATGFEGKEYPRSEESERAEAVEEGAAARERLAGGCGSRISGDEAGSAGEVASWELCSRCADEGAPSEGALAHPAISVIAITKIGRAHV